MKRSLYLLSTVMALTGGKVRAQNEEYMEGPPAKRQKLESTVSGTLHSTQDQSLSPLESLPLDIWGTGLSSLNLKDLANLVKTSNVMKQAVELHLNQRTTPLEARFKNSLNFKKFAKSAYSSALTHLDLSPLENWTNDLIPTIFDSFPNLISLNISSHEGRFGPEGAELLVQALKGNSKLKALNVSDNSLKSKEVILIINSLKNCPTLESLSLAHCSITNQEATLLAKSLVGNLHIKHLDLSYNFLEDAGLMTICLLLHENESIESINFEDNDITPDGIQIFSRLYPKEASLRSLTFSENNLGDAGAWALGSLLSRFPRIQTLKVENCGISGEGLYGLTSFVQNPKTAMNLYLENPNISEVQKNTLRNKLGDHLKSI